MTKTELLTQMCMIYWQWNITPNFTDPPDESPEAQVLSMYDTLKNNALIRYPWRSATKYIHLLPLVQETPADARYKYEAQVPDDFLLATGFWSDPQRRNGRQNSVDIVGRSARTNLLRFTMGYISSDVPEEEFDPWLCEWIKIYIAAEASDIAGQSTDRKLFLLEERNRMLIECGNKDFEMSHKDGISSSTHWFLEQGWY